MILWIEITLIIGNFRSLFARSFSDIIKIGLKSESFCFTRRQLDKRRIRVFSESQIFFVSDGHNTICIHQQHAILI